VLREWLTELNLDTDAIACIGDDAAEVPLLKVARLAVAVADAHPVARDHAHYITQAPGGLGAVRELCDLILKARVA
jgi:3-deoxy-D-manno-octulosonate 8-phosphate phosphatase (KDO 8-P phosphatase)